MAIVMPETKAEEERDINRLFRTQRFSLVLIALLFSAAWFYLTVLPERPAHALMEFTHAGATGKTALCPGDILNYELELHVSGEGVFDLDVAVWRVTPPATVLFSQTRRMVFTGRTDYRLSREWVIPRTYASAIDGSPEQWAAGQYERRHSIVTVSRSTEPSIVSIPFSIREDCQ